MKRIFTSFLTLCIGFSAFSQSQRTVLIEEGSNASCPPCAAQNPAFKVLLDANTAKAVSLKYQWYFPGFDPMHNHNPAEANGRFETYYAQNGVPTAMIDGTIPSFGGNPYDGAPAGFTQGLIDTRHAVTSPFDIELTYSLTPETITVTATTTCTEATAGNFKLRIAVIEEHIEFASAPGSNGETDFYNVMKKFLPNADGLAMASTYAVGETFTTTQTWDLENVYDINEVAVVAFIQNDANKEVMQAKLASGLPVTPAFTTDAVAAVVNGVDGFSCEGSITPSVTIQNYGSAALTSLNVGYEINGTTGSIPWTGNLGFYETAIVSLGAINFTPDASNILNVTTTSPNGGSDENSANNSKAIEVGIAGYASLNITVEVRTDFYPGETSWEIRDENGTLVTSQQYAAGPGQGGSGGPDAGVTKTHQVTLSTNNCYSFKMFDSYGDGLQSFNGAVNNPPYGYTILNSGGGIIIQDQENSLNFGDETENAMRTDESSSINDLNEFTSFSVFPNPASSMINVEISLEKPEVVTVEVIDILGQRVKFEQFNNVATGVTSMPMSVSDLASGIYTLRVSSKSAESFMKFTIAK
jgi:hypothetical protein